MEIMTIWTIVASVVTAATIILKVVAPLTKNTKDDSVLKILQKILEMFSGNTKLD